MAIWQNLRVPAQSNGKRKPYKLAERIHMKQNIQDLILAGRYSYKDIQNQMHISERTLYRAKLSYSIFYFISLQFECEKNNPHIIIVVCIIAT